MRLPAGALNPSGGGRARVNNYGGARAGDEDATGNRRGGMVERSAEEVRLDAQPVVAATDGGGSTGT